MKVYPIIAVHDYKSDATIVKELLKCLSEFYYRSYDTDYIIDLQRTLISLDHYVTLIAFDGKGRLGFIDIDWTIRCHWNNLERLNKKWWNYGSCG